MVGIPLAVAVLVTTGWALALLVGARALADRFFDPDPSMPRLVGLLVSSAAAVVGLAFLSSGFLFWTVASIAVFVLLVVLATETRGSELRQRVAFAQLFLGLSAISYLHLRASNVVSGISMTEEYSYALHDYLARLSIPLLQTVVPASAPHWAGAHAIPLHFLSLLSQHVVFVVAFGAFVASALALTLLSERPVRRVGLVLLPGATVIALVLPIAWIATLALPGGTATVALGVVVALLGPPSFSEGLASLRWATNRWHVSSMLVAVVAVLALLSPLAVVGVSLFGCFAQLTRMRELGPLLAETERTLARPRLRGLTLGGLGVAILLGTLGGIDHWRTSRDSPLLGVTAETCVDVKSEVVEGGRGVSYEHDGARFYIEARARAPVGSDPEALCARHGLRVCTSDEWYLACLCNYPDESEGGMKLSTNNRLVYRVEAERRDAQEESSVEYQTTDVHGLLTGDAEVVGPALGRSAWRVAGATEARATDWAVDCRVRSVLPTESLPGFSSLGVRCCR